MSKFIINAFADESSPELSGQIDAMLRNGVQGLEVRGVNGKNIGALLNADNYYFVPFGQDAPEKKPASMVAHFESLKETIEEALENRQIQPLII